MNTNMGDIDNIVELELHLMTAALYFCNYAPIYHLNNKNSRIARSFENQDLSAIKKYARDLFADFAEFTDAEQKEYGQIYQKNKQNYEPALKSTPIPLPDDFIKEFIDESLQEERYLSAYNALNHFKRVDKKVNELVNHALQILASREVTSADKELTLEVQSLIQEAVMAVYQALRLRNPRGVPYQYLGVEMFMNEQDKRRKYEHYAEQGESVLKEILNFCLGYLLDDTTLGEKILNTLKTAKLRKLFLKQISIRVTGDEEKHQKYIDNFQKAVENIHSAKTEFDYLNTHRILLGRTTGDDSYVQYLKELATNFPISPLLVKINKSPAGSPFLAPLMLKEKSLLQVLDLDK